jgi:multidrug efflux pump
MRFLGIFILRPVATTLFCIAMVLAGGVAFLFLPVAQSLGNIAGLEEMSSRSTEGNTRITLMFDVDRDINGAARDVQAAINAARGLLPSSLRSNPTYRKVNPSSAPIIALALTSESATQGELYDLASTVLAQKIAQIPGVGEVQVGGSSLPAVRITLNPGALVSAGVALDDVRRALADATLLGPNGVIESADTRWIVSSGGQLTRAAQYRPLIVAWRDGAPIRLQDVAAVEDSVEDLFNTGFFNDRQAVLLIVRRQADANIIDTVDAIMAQLPALSGMVPPHVRLDVAQDRTPSIRATMQEAQLTLLIAVVLVVAVVLAFLKNPRAALIPAIAVPASLITTFSFMLWFNFTLNTLSLMALIVATGFVVDDAIVVLENIMRYIEKGLPPRRAALRGVREVGFTVLAMSLSLVAVFIPMLLMGGLPGSLFREFAVTLSVAIIISLLVSLTLTPMMCAHLLRRDDAAVARAGVFTRFMRVLGAKFWTGYQRSLQWALNHSRIVMVLLVATVGLNVYLYAAVPKGFFPQQDTGQLLGFFRVDQGTSFKAMTPKLDAFRQILLKDPAIDTVTGFAGGRGGSNSSFLMIQLKPLNERDVSATDVVNRLRGKFDHLPGARLFLVPQQDIYVGGSQSGSGSYEYSLLSGDLELLRVWLPRVQRAMAVLPELVDVDSDIEDKGTRVELIVDRDAAARLGVDMALVASTLNNSFSQRQVAVIYGPLNQYRVVMGVDPRFAQDAQALNDVQVITANGDRVPLSAFTRFEVGNAPLSVRHNGLFAEEAVSFSLAPGVSLDQAIAAIDTAVAEIGLPSRQIQAGYAGAAQALQKSLAQQPWLILGALVTMYIVLGMLYESYIHPVTILSTLPSAGIGALLALLWVDEPFTLIALIGVFLLIGIVKKNAIMMVDFALLAERRDGLSTRDAIYQACLVRFRPIMMTTVSALFGALPLVLATGAGVEMRRPLGLTIVGGLVLSQVLTLYTTPVVYLYLDRLRRWAQRRRGVTPGGQQLA